jgi:hypothetical protein
MATIWPDQLDIAVNARAIGGQSIQPVNLASGQGQRGHGAGTGWTHGSDLDGMAILAP